MSNLKNQNANTQMTIDKQARRWADSNTYKYKDFIPAICQKSLKQIASTQTYNQPEKDLSKNPATQIRSLYT